jgi:hypothetical protein
MTRVALAVCCLSWVLLASAAGAEPLTFRDLKARFNKSATSRPLVDKNAVLTLDDDTRRLTVQTQPRPLAIGYDQVRAIVFDVSTHMRGGALASLVGGVAGAAIASQHVDDYWMHIAYADGNGAARTYMLEIPQHASSAIIEKMQALFPGLVTVTAFDEKETVIDKDTLTDLPSKHELKIDEKTRPMPEATAGKALIVVVCPPLAARYTGKGPQFKLHANDRVIAVNKPGTYSFAALEPGEYLFVAQTENASGFRMTVEAGKEYYLLQNMFAGMWKARTKLSRHSKELVMYELSGAHYANWTRK